MVSRTVVPQRHPNLWICYLTWQKRPCMIKLRILSWRDYHGLSVWAQYNHMDFYEGGRRVWVRKGHVTTEAETGVMWGHEPRKAGSLWKLEKARNEFLPREGRQLNWHLHSSQKMHFRLLFSRSVRKYVCIVLGH